MQAEKTLETAHTPESVSVLLEDDIDISRGDMLVDTESVQPFVGQQLKMMVCWFNAQPMQLRRRYILRGSVSEVIGMVQGIDYRVDMHTLDQIVGDTELKMNDIAMITVRTAGPLVYDRYADNRTTGSLVFIDADSFETVGGGMIQ